MKNQAPRSDFAPGTIIAKRFSIEEVLGRGAMGTVYRARHLWLDTQIALKVLHPYLVDNDFATGRLLEEARSVAKLKSENVVRVLDTGRTTDGVVYLAMEYVHGHDLEVEMRELKRFPEPRVMNIVRDVCGALVEAHGAGIVHRDLKPENLLIDRTADGFERIKVVDFGVAKRLGAHAGRKLTLESCPVGTPSYMAPEQITHPTRVDARADIFALGVVMYEMLSGRLPFDGGNTLEIYAATLHGAPPPLEELVPDVTPELARIVARCLEKDPNARFADASEFIAAFDQVPHSVRRKRSVSAPDAAFPSVEVDIEATPSELKEAASNASTRRRSSATPVLTTLVSEDTRRTAVASRFSLWSAIALTAVLSVAAMRAPENFENPHAFWTNASRLWSPPRLETSRDLPNHPHAQPIAFAWTAHARAEPNEGHEVTALEPKSSKNRVDRAAADAATAALDRRESTTPSSPPNDAAAFGTPSLPGPSPSPEPATALRESTP